MWNTISEKKRPEFPRQIWISFQYHISRKSSRGRPVDPYGRTGACDFVNAPKTMADKIRAERVMLQREHTTIIRPRISRRWISVFIQLSSPLYFWATSECSADLFLAQSNKPNTIIITNAPFEVHTFRYSTGPHDQIFNWFVRMV